MLRTAFAFALLALVACHPAAPAAAPHDGSVILIQRVRELLAAYGSNDPAAVLRLCDPEQITMYGSDAAEVVRGADGVRQLMSDDFRLWGSASFGEPRDMDVREGVDLASVFFDVPFRAKVQPREVIVRVATVWRKRSGAWVLTQSSNVVPTVGSSAKQLLAH